MTVGDARQLLNEAIGARVVSVEEISRGRWRIELEHRGTDDYLLRLVCDASSVTGYDRGAWPPVGERP